MALGKAFGEGEWLWGQLPAGASKADGWWVARAAAGSADPVREVGFLLPPGRPAPKEGRRPEPASHPSALPGFLRSLLSTRSGKQTLFRGGGF